MQNRPWILALMLAAGAATVLWAAPPWSKPRLPEIGVPAAAANEPAPAGAAPTNDRVRNDDARLPREDTAWPAASPSAPIATPAFGHGFVVDVTGETVPGIRLRCADLHGLMLAGGDIVSDHAGRFVWPRPATGGIRVSAAASGWTSILEPMVFDVADTGDDEWTVVVAPSTRLQGLVVDGHGLAVPAATIVVHLHQDVRTSSPRVLDRCVPREWELASAADGSFALGDAPQVPIEVTAVAPGHAAASLVCRPPCGPLQLVLGAGNEPVLAGVVHMADGGSPAGAIVECGDRWVRVEADGRFAFALHQVRWPVGSAPRVRAGKDDFVPVEVVPRAEPWQSRASWPDDVVLVLRETALAISGRTVRSDGTACDCLVDVVGRDAWPDMRSTDLATAAPQPEWMPPMRKRATGEFTVGRLRPGSYRLCGFDPASMQTFVTGEIVAGTSGHSIELPPLSTWPAFVVDVVDRHGQPVAGAEFEVEGDAAAIGQPPCRGRSGRADAAGRLTLAPLARSVHTLLVRAPGVHSFRRVALAQIATAGPVRVTVPIAVRCSVRLARADEPIDAVAFVDAAGQRVEGMVTAGDTAVASATVRLAAGRSMTFQLPDDVVDVILLTGPREVRRAPVVLRPGEANVLQP